MFQETTSGVWPFLEQLDTTSQPILTLIPGHHDSPSVHRHFANSAPIEFWVNGRKGVRLLDVQTDNLLGLADADVEVMNALGVKVTYKIEWSGYAPFKRQMNARRVHGTQCRARIAKQIAQLVEEFFHMQTTYHTNVDSKSPWRVGSGSIEYESLYLMELRRISRSTWVIVLAYSA